MLVANDYKGLQVELEVTSLSLLRQFKRKTDIAPIQTHTQQMCVVHFWELYAVKEQNVFIWQGATL